ncbi:MAG: hypothetical protein Q4D32_04110 [Eubacteriales bacterium]|nr:hypothetical protein [Eubacteriales bacterium]
MQEKIRLSITTYIHFLVDFTCVYWMYHMILRQTQVQFPGDCSMTNIDYSIGWVLFYNFCAFVLQLPIGWMVDRFWQRKPWRVESLGCVVIGIASVWIFGAQLQRGAHSSSFYTDMQGVWMAVVLGIGNALFHVGAGVEILQYSSVRGHKRRRLSGSKSKGFILSLDCTEYRMTPVGIFVSSGALGLFIGSKLASHLSPWDVVWYEAKNYDTVFVIYSLLVIALIFGAAVLCVFATGRSETHVRKAGQHKNMDKVSEEEATVQRPNVPETGQGIAPVAAQAKPWDFGIIFLLFFVVVLRSFQGTLVQFDWKEGMMVGLIFTLCIVAGKALGGVLADWLGVFWGTVLPLGVSTILFLASEHMASGLLAVLLFQTTMPITLSLMHRQFRGYPGTAFGLLTFGLFLGGFPKTLYAMYQANAGGDDLAEWFSLTELYIYSIVTGISLVLMLLVLFLWKREE